MKMLHSWELSELCFDCRLSELAESPEVLEANEVREELQVLGLSHEHCLQSAELLALALFQFLCGLVFETCLQCDKQSNDNEI